MKLPKKISENSCCENERPKDGGFGNNPVEKIQLVFQLETSWNPAGYPGRVFGLIQVVNQVDV